MVAWDCQMFFVKKFCRAFCHLGAVFPLLSPMVIFAKSVLFLFGDGAAEGAEKGRVGHSGAIKADSGRRVGLRPAP